MIGSADWMLRLSRDFGKREKFAALRREAGWELTRHCCYRASDSPPEERSNQRISEHAQQ
jgi:hypothetical protein